MRADQVIEMYVDDTVRLLPKRQRDDVAAELRSLLNEELDARARDSGCPADETLALSLVRGYGSPGEAAARYQPTWTVIDPADSRSFLRAGVIGAGVLVLLSALRKQRPPAPGNADDLVALGIPGWLGVLVLAFGLKSWIRRNWPSTALWKPRDRDRVNRVGAAIVVPLATLVVILYAAPARVFDLVSGGRFDTSWLAYTADFQRLRLPCFIGCLAGLLALLSFAAIRGRWSRLTRRIGIGLNMVLAGLVLFFAVDGNIFQSAEVDRIARDVLTLAALIYVSGVGIQIYGEMGRIDRTAAPPLRTRRQGVSPHFSATGLSGSDRGGPG
jgi:hypothetical protein